MATSTSVTQRPPILRHVATLSSRSQPSPSRTTRSTSGGQYLTMTASYERRRDQREHDDDLSMGVPHAPTRTAHRWVVNMSAVWPPAPMPSWQVAGEHKGVSRRCERRPDRACPEGSARRARWLGVPARRDHARRTWKSSSAADTSGIASCRPVHSARVARADASLQGIAIHIGRPRPCGHVCDTRRIP